MGTLVGCAFMLGALYALLWVFKARRLNRHIDQALAVVAEDRHTCEACSQLTAAVVDYGFEEITEDGLSPAEYRRLKRLGGLFGVQPPVIPGREDQ